MRAEFDKNKDIKDLRIAKKLLEDGEEELFKKLHPIPFKCKMNFILLIRLMKNANYISILL